MEKISNVQLIDVGAGRTVVRYYNAEKDCFECICKAKQVFVRGLYKFDDAANKLIVADGRIWLLWDEKLRYVCNEYAATLLQGGGHILKKYDVSQTALPFDLLLVHFDGDEPKSWVPVKDYECDLAKMRVEYTEYVSGARFCFEVPRGVLSDFKPCIICRG